MTEKKKSHKRQGKPWNQVRAEERQEFFFLIYEQMGVNRTLKRLWGVCRSVGVKISLSTLEDYSSKYNWQVRILERAARHEAADFQDVQDQVERMNVEHARTFQDIGALVTAGIKHYKAKIEKELAAGLDGTLAMDLPDLGRLAEVYQRGERLARGQATSKAEIIVGVLPPLVKDIFAVFLAVNVITNDSPDLVKKRQSEFITRADAVLVQYYGGQKQLEGGQQ
jgi:hypothetical protein